MGILDRLRGRRSEVQQPLSATGPPMIRVFDTEGRELQIPREEWRTRVLPHNLAAARDEPERLAGVLIDALHNGFARDLVADAEHLARTDHDPVRAALLLGVTYVESDRLDDSERVLREALAAHGENATVLFNLAKLQSLRGDRPGCDATLWHALEVDPNQENAFAWFTATRRDVAVAQPALDPTRRVAALPRSWRAQIWLARDALECKDVAAALRWYDEALAHAPQPAPADLLMQLSGDLGKAGRIPELVERLAPRISPERHGLAVGNNLLKAYLDLGQPGPARALLDALYAQQRPDWRETLEYWALQIARVELEQKRAQESPGAPLETTVLSVPGPLWASGPLAALRPARDSTAIKLGFLGSAVELAGPGQPGAQLSDPPGRLSRALPLFLAEEFQLGTGAVASALIPWVRRQGFAVFGGMHADAAACALAARAEHPPPVVCALLVDTTGPRAWRVAARCLDVASTRLLTAFAAELPLREMGPAVERFVRQAMDALCAALPLQRVARPGWAVPLVGAELSDYLLRVEQQLAVTTYVQLAEGGISGEHEILEGAFQLCVRNPTLAVPRLLLARTLVAMHAARPALVAPTRERWQRLDRQHPLTGAPAAAVTEALREVFP